MDIFKSWLVDKYIAHRGYHNLTDSPENSLKAFQNAIDKNYAIELDVHIISDGTIIVFHDNNLKRMANTDGYVENLKLEDLSTINLLNTDEKIPTLQEALTLINGKTPVLIEIKNYGKIGELEQKVIDILKKYKGEFAVQSFNPYSLEYFKKHAPHILRGQLSSFFKNNNQLSFFKKAFLKRMYFNKKISKPHFISYQAENLPNRFVSKFSNLPVLAWTIKTQQQYEKIIKYSDNIIFEGFEPKI